MPLNVLALGELIELPLGRVSSLQLGNEAELTARALWPQPVFHVSSVPNPKQVDFRSLEAISIPEQSAVWLVCVMGRVHWTCCFPLDKHVLLCGLC